MTANTPRKTTAKKAAPKPTSPREWKKAQAEPIEMPSGNYMRVRRMNMQTLMATGRMPNSLMKIVKDALDKGTGMSSIDTEQILEDDKQLQDLMTFMDTLVCMVALEPRVLPTPQDEADRDEDTLYADEVDQEDKSFLFALVTGGTKNLETFREATRSAMDAVPGRQDVVLPALGTSKAD